MPDQPLLSFRKRYEHMYPSHDLCRSREELYEQLNEQRLILESSGSGVSKAQAEAAIDDLCARLGSLSPTPEEVVDHDPIPITLTTTNEGNVGAVSTAPPGRILPANSPSMSTISNKNEFGDQLRHSPYTSESSDLEDDDTDSIGSAAEADLQKTTSLFRSWPATSGLRQTLDHVRSWFATQDCPLDDEETQLLSLLYHHVWANSPNLTYHQCAARVGYTTSEVYHTLERVNEKFAIVRGAGCISSDAAYSTPRPAALKCNTDGRHDKGSHAPQEEQAVKPSTPLPASSPTTERDAGGFQAARKRRWEVSEQGAADTRDHEHLGKRARAVGDLTAAGKDHQDLHGMKNIAASPLRKPVASIDAEVRDSASTGSPIMPHEVHGEREKVNEPSEHREAEEQRKQNEARKRTISDLTVVQVGQQGERLPRQSDTVMRVQASSASYSSAIPISIPQCCAPPSGFILFGPLVDDGRPDRRHPIIVHDQKWKPWECGEGHFRPLAWNVDERLVGKSSSFDRGDPQYGTGRICYVFNSFSACRSV